ncbi:hypothetical protein [Kribbella sp. NPDC055071]
MTTTGNTSFGVEWSDHPDDDQHTATGWPTLHSAERCDGENPMTGSPCISGHHKGHHRDTNGAEWLDD